MNDSIQNLHKRIKKEVNVEIGRGNLIECRYPEILSENRHARTSRLHRKRKIRTLRATKYRAAAYSNFCSIELSSFCSI